jgi:hypothetical protein
MVRSLVRRPLRCPRAITTVAFVSALHSCHFESTRGTARDTWSWSKVRVGHLDLDSVHKHTIAGGVCHAPGIPTPAGRVCLPFDCTRLRVEQDPSSCAAHDGTVARARHLNRDEFRVLANRVMYLLSHSAGGAASGSTSPMYLLPHWHSFPFMTPAK